MKIINGKDSKDKENGKYYFLFNHEDGQDVPSLIFKAAEYISDTSIEVSRIVIGQDEHDRPYLVVHPAENDF